MAAIEPQYPLNLTIDYKQQLDRLTTAFRIFTIIPIAIVLGLLVGGHEESSRYAYYAPGFVFLPLVLMILFRQKYPRWWFDWNLMLARFSTRVGAYLLLLRDEYPSTDEEQAVHLGMVYPNAQTDLNRWLPLVKWFLAIPHYIVLFFLFIGVFFAAVIAWFAILLTGDYPRGLFDYVVGVIRWALRVQAYAFILITDLYPPFRLSA